MAPSRASALLAEPVSPELALVDPILRRQLLAALGRPRSYVLVNQPPVESIPAQTFAPAIPSQDVPRKNGAAGRHAQERLGYVVAGVALTVGCAIGLISTLPHRGTTDTPPPTAPTVAVSWPIVAPSISSETSVQRRVPAKPNRPSKASVRLDPFLPPDPTDGLPSTQSNSG